MYNYCTSNQNYIPLPHTLHNTDLLLINVKLYGNKLYEIRWNGLLFLVVKKGKRGQEIRIKQIVSNIMEFNLFICI